ncbi:MAG: HAMP domain-containing histidine kinase [Gemmatimonadetes bacterium]|nr:HAMP domain-containing histidine kinase [Gemmatimonadota bacterium]
MNSIRGRLTLAYAIVLALTLAMFSAVLLSASRGAAERAIKSRVEDVAELASVLLQQAGTAALPVVATTDSVIGQELSAGVRRLLSGLPGYIIVTDTVRVLYASAAVERLTTKDRGALTRAVFRELTPDQPGGIVALDSARLFVLAHFETPSARVPIYRVVAGEPAQSLDLSRLDIFASVTVAFPVLLLLSVLVAWVLAGASLRPIDRLIGELEAIQDGRSLHRRLPVETDENELDRLAGTINAMIARLEGSFAALRRFTADASHELKTPLTVLRADIERAMQSPQVSMDQLPALEEALAETTRMADLVESLLTLARADEGRFDIHREVVALAPLVEDVYETAAMLAESSGARVELRRLDPATVSGDPVRLRQLLLNLVTNALKYTSRGGKVTLALELRGERVAFSVQDTGLGIAAADLPFIFDRFWRADRARSRGGERGGFGLGLAIAQWIAHAHGGNINVASRLGRGSTFTVSLPVMPSPNVIESSSEPTG